MYFTLAIFAGIVGLTVVGASIYTAWYMLDAAGRKKQEQPAAAAVELASHYLLKWTALDYAGLLLSCVGLLFLLADLIGVIREKASYPYYHYGYLLCSFVFLAVSVLFLVTRLTVVLRISRTERGAGSEHGGEPDQTYRSE